VAYGADRRLKFVLFFSFRSAFRSIPGITESDFIHISGIEIYEDLIMTDF
jgi:hypothetical protein